MNDAAPQPMATYRLQLNKDLRLADAQTLAPYFSRLGVTHVYMSPILRARSESTHGYDVADCATIHPPLGNETDLRSLSAALQTYGLGTVLDIVPNHMATSMENPYWRDVLTYGSCSPFAKWFDIDWRMPDHAMWGRVLVPILGEPRRRVLDQGQIRLTWHEGRFLIEYFAHRLPIDPATIPMICQFGMADLRERLAGDRTLLAELIAILKPLRKLPKIAVRQRRRVTIDREETERQLALFAQLVVQSPRMEQWINDTAAAFGAGDDGADRLEKLLDAQPYRLAHWRDAARAINYRRFFDINELVSVRQEVPQVFEETHATILRWVEAGVVDGLRIDHIDGLRDPLGYLQRLAEACRTRRPRGVPLFVEKILARHEELPRAWPVEGTTGYEFLCEAEAIFLAPAGVERIVDDYRGAVRRAKAFELVAAAGKRRVLQHDLSPHVGRLADILHRLYTTSSAKVAAVAQDEFAPAARDEAAFVSPALSWERREISKAELVDAIVEVIVALPVYRTYVDSRNRALAGADRRFVEVAIEAARASGRAAPEAIDVLAQMLLLDEREELSDHDRDERVNFILRFQQLTGPAAAKGVEDTALYSYVPLVALNEVGGEPVLPAESAVDLLHRANLGRAATWPRSMLCVTTHDTKRTADVRARLDVLSELPKLWTDFVARWQRMHGGLRVRAGNVRAPDTATELLCYQTIVGIWPTPDSAQRATLPDAETLDQLRERVEAYMLKAVREAKVHTSWTRQDKAYEQALLEFVRGILAIRAGNSQFIADVQKLVARICRPGFWNSLARTLIQYTAPGTPDLYQGDELWNFALVDPDNRRPVDYVLRQSLLENVVTGIDAGGDARRAFVAEMVAAPEDGRIKLHMIRAGLAARRHHPMLFSQGEYLPLGAIGEKQEHVFAFARLPCGARRETASREAAIVVAPRLTASLAGEGVTAPIGVDVWRDTVIEIPPALEGRKWKCGLSGETLKVEGHSLLVGELFAHFPAALLVAG
jgi:(1->4)-alpha-D-glucan 1-alpha-D-glucosylmutase